MNQHHYTDKDGYNAIRAATVWHFQAHKPPGNHPFGAYFTTLGRGTRNLSQRLRIPRSKSEYVFEFTDVGDLTPLTGGRGRYIFYSPHDYGVDVPRQIYSGVA